MKIRKDMKPEAFFKEIFVNPLNRLLEEKGDSGLTVDATLQMNLLGNGGGNWSFKIEEGKVQMDDWPCDEPAIQITMTMEDWRRLFLDLLWRREDMKPENLKGDHEEIIRSVANPKKMGNLKLLSGNLQVVTKDLEDESRKLRMTITFGDIPYDVENPDSKVFSSIDIIIDVLRKKANAEKMAESGQIGIKGSLILPTKVAALLAL